MSIGKIIQILPIVTMLGMGVALLVSSHRLDSLQVRNESLTEENEDQGVIIDAMASSSKKAAHAFQEQITARDNANAAYRERLLTGKANLEKAVEALEELKRDDPLLAECATRVLPGSFIDELYPPNTDGSSSN